MAEKMEERKKEQKRLSDIPAYHGFNGCCYDCRFANWARQG